MSTTGTRRLARLPISLDLLIAALKSKGTPRYFEVIENALPDDVVLAWAYTENGTAYAIIESESFNPVADGDAVPDCLIPICRVVYE